jgi:hypothetical protein
MSSEGKKVIFLDHDGVICLSTEWGGRYKKQRAHFTKENPRKGAEDGPVDVRFDNFNKKAISTLNVIFHFAEYVCASPIKYLAILTSQEFF